MEKYLIALLLSGNKLNKRQILVTMSLCLHYAYFKEKYSNKQKGLPSIAMSDITAQTGVNTHEVALVVDSLCDFNIIGRVICEETMSSKRIVEGLGDEFIKDLGMALPPDKSQKALLQPILKACNRAYFSIKDNSKAYLFNPDIATWKFPNWAKIKRGVENIKEKFDLKEIAKITAQYKKNKNGKLTTQENQDAGYLIRQFAGRFKEFYNTEYAINAVTEVRMLKTLIIQFERNGIQRAKIPEFFTWAFERKKGKVVHIALLRYVANEYLVHLKKENPVVDYEVDDEGHRIVKEKK